MDRVRAKLEWFKTTLLPHEGALRNRLRRILPPTQELEDTLAEVLARAYATEKWELVTAGRAYLFTIARNLVIDNARRNKIVSFETIADLEMLQSEMGLEGQLHARDALRQVEAIVAALPAQCRRVFILRRVHEKSMGEIAEEMGLSVSTVEKHLAKAIAIVMRAWSQQEETGLERAAAGWTKPETDRGHGRAVARAAVV